jgi:predicted phage terminase large subunit-like protein
VRGDLLGRRLEGCPIVAQGTRYSLYDPIGRLQEIAPTMGWRTKILEIPALDPVTDESNFEVTLNGRRAFTTDYYRHERELVTPVQWASQFQQEPFEAKGLLFPENELNRYFELPADKDPDAVIAVCDTAEGGGDSVMLPIAYIYGQDVFIEDCVFDNGTPEFTKPQCAKKLMQHKVSVATFESNAAGTYFARDVEELVRKMGGKISIRTKRSISNKHTRIEMASDGVLKHFYFKDKSLYKPNDQYGLMMRELTTYVRTGKVLHDDAPDGISMLENEIRSLNTAKVEVFQRPW